MSQQKKITKEAKGRYRVKEDLKSSVPQTNYLESIMYGGVESRG